MISGLPTLKGGGHQPDSGSACIMEYISVLVGEPWSDMPSCTNPVIARVAQRVNDHLDDDNRWRLLEFIPRLTSTSRIPDPLLPAELDTLLAKWVWRTYEGNIAHPLVRINLRSVVQGEFLDSQNAFDVLSACLDPLEDEPDLLVGAVAGILDEYDRLAGVQVDEFTEEDYAEATAKIAAYV